MSGRRSGSARLGALVLAATLAVALVLVMPTTAQGQEAPAPDAASARLRLGYQTPSVAPDGDFTVLLDVRGAPAGADLAVRIYDRIADESDLQASADDDPNHLLATFDTIPLAAMPTTKQGASFSINLYERGGEQPPGAWAYRLDEAGSYPVEVRLRDADGSVLTSMFTYLVRRPDAGEDAPTTRVAVRTDIRQDPPRSASAALDRIDPKLLVALEPVLASFADHPSVPATFTVSPDTAARLTADPAGAPMLARLRTEIRRDSHQLLSAPYVGIDVAALVDGGLADEVVRQADLGLQTLTATLGRPDARTWALDRPIDGRTFPVLERIGVDRVVLPPAALLGGERRTPVALGGPGNDVVALTASDAFALEAHPQDPVLAANQILGRLAALATTSGGPTGVVLDVDASTTDPDELRALLDGLGTLNPYLRPSTVEELFTEVPAPGIEAALAPHRPAGLGDYPGRSAATHQLVASFRSMVKDRPELVQAAQRPLALSAAAGIPLATRQAMLGRVEAQVRGRVRTITVPPQDKITLGARTARFPLTVTSGLDYPVQVVIQLEASDRLSFPNDRIEATLQRGRNLVPIRVRTRSPGNTPLQITVRSPDGQIILAESRYTVRSTAVSGVGILLTIGAAGFLALWWGRHWYRNRRQARHARPRPGRPPRSGAGAVGPDAEPDGPQAGLDEADLDDDIADESAAPVGASAEGGPRGRTRGSTDVTDSSDSRSNPG